MSNFSLVILLFFSSILAHPPSPSRLLSPFLFCFLFILPYLLSSLLLTYANFLHSFHPMLSLLSATVLPLPEAFYQTPPQVFSSAQKINLVLQYGQCHFTQFFSRCKSLQQPSRLSSPLRHVCCLLFSLHVSFSSVTDVLPKWKLNKENGNGMELNGRNL
jgi:putative effector of murein hydrolase